MTVLAPDELVQRLCEEIAYAGGSMTPMFNLSGFL